jgi:hypothetical protein
VSNRRPLFESLEGRQLMAAVTAGVNLSGDLVVTGSDNWLKIASMSSDFATSIARPGILTSRTSNSRNTCCFHSCNGVLTT